MKLAELLKMLKAMTDLLLAVAAVIASVAAVWNCSGKQTVPGGCCSTRRYSIPVFQWRSTMKRTVTAVFIILFCVFLILRHRGIL